MVHRDVAMVEFGHHDYYEGIIEARMPLVLVANDPNAIGYRRYYFGFFGYVAKLPYEGFAPD